jgi:hypothetical protein
MSFIVTSASIVAKSTLSTTIRMIYPVGRGIGVFGKLGKHTLDLHKEFVPQQYRVPQQVPVSQNELPLPTFSHSALA